MYSHNNNSVERRVSRRPFLHMVVLFGNDPRVINYAQGIMQQFLDAGIDTWLHSAIYANNSSRQLVDIKPEHLVSVIKSSHADQLIVIGDRNMKNNTCQGRHDGKLIELSIREQIRFVLLDWSQATSMGGLKLSKSRSTSLSSTHTLNREQLQGITANSSNSSIITNAAEEDGSNINSARISIDGDQQLPLQQEESTGRIVEEQVEEEVIIMSDEEILNSLRQYGRTGNVNDRVNRLENMLTDLERFGNHSGGGALRPDRSMMGKLTKAQTSLIKLHTDVDHLITKVQRAPRIGIMEEEMDLSNPSATFEHLVKYMGLGRGIQVDGMYRPAAPGTMSKEVEDMLLPPLAEDFRDRALACLEKISVEVEALGSRLSAIAVGGGGNDSSNRTLINGKVEQRGSLWNHYIQDHRRKKEENKNKMFNMMEHSKNLTNVSGAKEFDQKPLTLNDLSADLRQLVNEGVLSLEQAIVMLKEQGLSDSSVNKNSSNDRDGINNNDANDADSWKLTGAAGKKKKKQKRRELEEQRRREREANARRIAEMEAREKMQRRQQQQQKMRAQQMAQQEARRRAQEQQQMQLRQQMEMMQRQLQQQIQIQRATAAQIQMQIEEQQRQAILGNQRKSSRVQGPQLRQQVLSQQQQQHSNRNHQGQQNRKHFQQQNKRGQQGGRNNQHLNNNANTNANNFQPGTMMGSSRGDGNLNIIGRTGAGNGGVNSNTLNEGMVNLNFNNNSLPPSLPPSTHGMNSNNVSHKQQQRIAQMHPGNTNNNINFGVSNTVGNKNNINNNSSANGNNQSIQFVDTNANFPSGFNRRNYNNVNNSNSNVAPPSSNENIKVASSVNNKNADNKDNVNLQQESSGFHNPYNTQTVGGGINGNANLPYSANSRSFIPQDINSTRDSNTSNDVQDNSLWTVMNGGNNSSAFKMNDSSQAQMNIGAKEFVPNVAAKEFIPSGFAMLNAPMNGVYAPPVPDSPPRSSLMKPQNDNMLKGPSSTNGWSGNSYPHW